MEEQINSFRQTIEQIQENLRNISSGFPSVSRTNTLAYRRNRINTRLRGQEIRRRRTTTNSAVATPTFTNSAVATPTFTNSAVATPTFTNSAVSEPISTPSVSYQRPFNPPAFRRPSTLVVAADENLNFEQIFEAFGLSHVFLAVIRRETHLRATAEDIAANSVVFTAEDGEYDKDGDCPICLCNYKPNDSLRRLNCKHYYHKDCIDKCLEKDRRCPLCRKDLFNKD